jgi:hypothetical protein
MALTCNLGPDSRQGWMRMCAGTPHPKRAALLLLRPTLQTSPHLSSVVASVAPFTAQNPNSPWTAHRSDSITPNPSTVSSRLRLIRGETRNPCLRLRNRTISRHSYSANPGVVLQLSAVVELIVACDIARIDHQSRIGRRGQLPFEDEWLDRICGSQLVSPNSRCLEPLPCTSPLYVYYVQRRPTVLTAAAAWVVASRLAPSMASIDGSHPDSLELVAGVSMNESSQC